MKLYYSPGACSLAPHIALEEAGLAYEAVLAPTKTKQLPDGSDFRRINPLGYVPLLELDDGTRLAENPVILSWIAQHAKQGTLAPAIGTPGWYEVMQWTCFVGSELHARGFGPFFAPTTSDEAKAATRERLAGRLKHVDEQLEGRTWLTGDDFTIADIYLVVVTNWASAIKFDLAPFPRLVALRERANARPAVQKARKAEGLPQA